MIKKFGLRVDEILVRFIEDEALDGLDIDASEFWEGFSALLNDLAPKNRVLLKKRDALQSQIDTWNAANKDSFEADAYEDFLRKIGYIVSTDTEFKVNVTGVDDEIAEFCGPQLVVPASNARFALNAANARWGSLYDALYGSDVLGSAKPGAFDPEHGAKVVAWVRDFLDEVMPLAQGSWKAITKFEPSLLQNIHSYVGTSGDGSKILLTGRDLMMELVFDATRPIGATDKIGLADVILEAALTTIIDCEDSVAAVDAEDKVQVYRNWLGLMKRDLSETITKNGKTFTRSLNEDRTFIDASGEEIDCPGTSVLLIRNVGHLMTNPAILLSDGSEVPEGLMDAMITSLIALHDVDEENGAFINSPEGSIYIVKPKMHGPEEVAFAIETFERVEEILGLPPRTIKIGIMDEERRTTVNLKECIRAAKNRVFFINTGFLDRTGDEIHTSMGLGPMLRKGDMKQATWLLAYEQWNVDRGLKAGLPGTAQIGKGMWAMPDLMADMMVQKIDHLRAGASTAWVPSPTAATLHATHYFRLSVEEIQEQLAARKPARLRDLLTVPVVPRPHWSAEDIQLELDNNAQGLLGYVVRWVQQGIGCSKVPDINNVGLMEDRATLRISSQHMANWLKHGVCTRAQVDETLRRMAKVVDAQNAADPSYRAMSSDFDSSLAFQAACDLVFKAEAQPNGYTEPLLHAYRLKAKARQSH